MNFCRILSTSLILFSLESARAQNPEVLELDSAKLLVSYRFAKNPPKNPKLLAVSEALRAQNWELCLIKFGKGANFPAHLRPWLQTYWLRCARESAMKSGKTAPLLAALSVSDKNMTWLSQGEQKEELKREYLSSTVEALRRVGARERIRGWQLFDRVQAFHADVSKSDLADSYKVAGEMAFLQQNLAQAHHFFVQSLDLKPSDELKQKTAAITAKLVGDTYAQNSALVKPTVTPELLYSDDEIKALEKFRLSQKSADYVAQVSDGVALINQFPGSKNKKEISDAVIKVYLTALDATDRPLQTIKSRMQSDLTQAPPADIYAWAQTLMGRGFYAEAQPLLEEAYKKSSGLSLNTSVLRTWARVSYALGDFSRAESNFKTLLNEHAGGEEGVESLLYLGFLNFRKKDYAAAKTNFERLLAVNNESKNRNTALYFLYRSLQKSSEKKSGEKEDKQVTEVRKQILTEFPLTYYGIRVALEDAETSAPWTDQKVSLKSRVWLSPAARSSWKNYLDLMAGGFFRSAEQELQAIQFPNRVPEQLAYSILLAQTYDYDKAFSVVTELMDREPSLRNREVMSFYYPKEFSKEVIAGAKAANLDSDLVLAVIRQESSFDTEAQSPANATGLMQLMIPTAKEIAGQLKMTDVQWPYTLTLPERNVRIGSQYLRQTLNRFDGHLPIALAAYNVGPARFKRWLAVRPDSQAILKTKSSDPAAELWIEEMPWDESKYYVKSVLRNFLIYKWLYSTEKPKLSDPVWQRALSHSEILTGN